jgi:hypothetical protein
MGQPLDPLDKIYTSLKVVKRKLAEDRGGRGSGACSSA